MKKGEAMIKAPHGKSCYDLRPGEYMMGFSDRAFVFACKECGYLFNYFLVWFREGEKVECPELCPICERDLKEEYFWKWTSDRFVLKRRRK